MPRVQPQNLIFREISQTEDLTNIEGRLIQVPDKHCRFGRVNDQKIKSVPQLRMGGSAIVPASQYGKEGITVRILENIVHLIAAEQDRSFTAIKNCAIHELR